MNPSKTTMTTIRIVLFAILLLGMIGSGAELLLLNHTEDLRQWIPLILLGTGLLVCAWHGVYSSALSVRVLQTILLGYILSGFVGMYFHYQGSAEFKLETNPSLPAGLCSAKRSAPKRRRCWRRARWCSLDF